MLKSAAPDGYDSTCLGVDIRAGRGGHHDAEGVANAESLKELKDMLVLGLIMTLECVSAMEQEVSSRRVVGSVNLILKALSLLM